MSNEQLLPDKNKIENEVINRGFKRISLTVKGFQNPLALWFWKTPSSVPSKGNILLLHGGSYSCLSVFDLSESALIKEGYSLFEALAKTGYDVYGLDLGGYGFSSGIEPKTIGDFDKQVEAAVAYISRDKKTLSLIGWSFGAHLAARAASSQMNIITNAILWGGFWGGGIKGLPEIIRRIPSNLPSRKINTEQHAGSDFQTVGTFDPKVKTAVVLRSLTIDPTCPSLSLSEVKNAPLHFPERIKSSLLVIHGEYDHIAQPEDWSEYISKVNVSKKKHIIFKKTDHNCQHGLRRKEFVQELNDFITGRN